VKNHIKVYLDHFDYDTDDYIACEVCGRKAVDIHHIKARGMGGSKEMDVIENLQALCRSCHLEYGDKKQWMEFLKDKHKDKLNGKR
jgi:5-methylcytosine-specific restriction endonuclease McrA